MKLWVTREIRLDSPHKENGGKKPYAPIKFQMRMSTGLDVQADSLTLAADAGGRLGAQPRCGWEHPT